MRTLLFLMALFPAVAGATKNDVTFTSVNYCYFFSDGVALCEYPDAVIGGKEGYAFQRSMPDKELLVFLATQQKEKK